MIFRPFYAWAMAMKPHTPDLASNPKAKRDYHMVELFEAGIVLRGTEVKSLRAGRGEIKDAFARVEHGEVDQLPLSSALTGEQGTGNRLTGSVGGDFVAEQRADKRGGVVAPLRGRHP